ncbi:hypothetical protein GCM10025774_38160 [Microbacterium kyungheense]
MSGLRRHDPRLRVRQHHRTVLPDLPDGRRAALIDPTARPAGSIGPMSTPQQPATITLAPVPDDKNLLTVVDAGDSCCGGGSCSIG